MTIRVERHALLRVISTTPSPSCNPSLDPLICEDEEFVIVELPEKKAEQQQHPFFDPATTDDDQTIDSSDDDYSADSTESRVSFADNLVTDVWTRPYTPVEDVPSLFYDSDTIAQFRHEYRLERKVMSELAIDPETLSNVSNEEELSNLLVPPTSPAASSSPLGAVCAPGGRHRISRVVVLHNDKLETFFNQAEEDALGGLLNDDDSSESSTSLPLSSSFCLGLEDSWQEKQQDIQEPQPTNCASDHHQHQSSHQTADFFDNDSFWSGSLTWY